MQQKHNFSTYRLITSVILYTFGLIILLWFLYKIISILVLSLFAVVLALIINQPVGKLEKKGMKRWQAATVVLGSIFIVVTLLLILVVPHISSQIDALIGNLPGYLNSVSLYFNKVLQQYPGLGKELQGDGFSLSSAMPSLDKTVMSLGNFSFSVLGGVFLFIVFISMIVFFVGNPKPVIELYLSVFEPNQRPKAEKALRHTSIMLGGWMKSNLIGGIIQAILVFAFLSILKVPGALIWAAMAFFSELIPKIGFYLMAIPPTLVALSVSPATAFWCLVFFLVMNELVADLLMPKLRSATMNIHPVSLLFLLLAMAAAFGLMGALLATPMAAIIKAYYEEFYIRRFKNDPHMGERVERILYK